MSGYTLAQSFGHGRTEQSTVAVKQPAAGANAVLTLTRYDRWRLVGCVFTLATDATAGNRYVTIEYGGTSTVSQQADAAAVLVAPSTTGQRFVGSVNRGTSEWNTGTDVLFPLSGLWLEAGRTVTINVATIGAGDQLSNVFLTFDRTLVRQDGSEKIRARELAQELGELLGG